MTEETRRIRIGMLTPSSNTVLEPVTQAILAETPAITAHFSRFKVTEIALDAAALAQFDDAPILAAAELLAHAKVDVISWNGTSASWLGIERDERLRERIESATGIRASSCILSLVEILRRVGATSQALVRPTPRMCRRRSSRPMPPPASAAEGTTSGHPRQLQLRNGPGRHDP